MSRNDTSRLPAEQTYGGPGVERWGPYREPSSLFSGWKLAALAVLAAGAWAAYAYGPDVRRYLKMHSM